MAKTLEARKIAGALGAEIRGIDLARDLDAATARKVRDIWLEHGVVFFREYSCRSGKRQFRRRDCFHVIA